MVAIFAGPASAAKHPVPLDPKADPSTCITCHENKTKGKSVHSAIAMGCLSCHEIRVNRDNTYVKLITATPYKLCLTCHTDKDSTQIKGKVHPPAVRDCLTCHDPHTSDNKNQLLKLTSGDKKDNLCLTCHTQGANVPESGSRHAALDMGCDTCHTTHKTGDRGKREFDFHLTKDAPALCLDCHDAKDASLVKAHQGQPFATADCLTCHDPHQSKAPKLMQAFLHDPFASKQCDICHAPAKDGKVVLTQASAKDLCVTCHCRQGRADREGEGAASGRGGRLHRLPQPARQVARRDFPKPDAVRCAWAATQTKRSRARNCMCTSRRSSRDAPPATSRTAAIMNICCGPRRRTRFAWSATVRMRKPQKLEGEHLVTIFDGKVKLPENYFGKVPVLPLKYDLGHPTERHPLPT